LVEKDENERDYAADRHDGGYHEADRCNGAHRPPSLPVSRDGGALKGGRSAPPPTTYGRLGRPGVTRLGQFHQAGTDVPPATSRVRPAPSLAAFESRRPTLLRPRPGPVRGSGPAAGGMGRPRQGLDVVVLRRNWQRQRRRLVRGRLGRQPHWGIEVALCDMS
jgi:hypothetical protein